MWVYRPDSDDYVNLDFQALPDSDKLEVLRMIEVRDGYLSPGESCERDRLEKSNAET